jgi:rubrerythrin
MNWKRVIKYFKCMNCGHIIRTLYPPSNCPLCGGGIEEVK